jgi:DNA-binding NarL/FixJ family response regulator
MGFSFIGAAGRGVVATGCAASPPTGWRGPGKDGSMSLRVFLVEDLKSIHLLMTELVSFVGGLRVVAIESTEAEARLWLEENAGGWDVAIIDLVLAQGSGMGVLQHARASSATGQVAVFSGYVSPGVRQHCMNLGADAVFDKAESAAFTAWLAALRPDTQPQGPMA